MLHRRMSSDDSRGVDEALDEQEPIFFGNANKTMNVPIHVRTTHQLLFSKERFLYFKTR